jgi:hypothetical protein
LYSGDDQGDDDGTGKGKKDKKGRKDKKKKQHLATTVRSYWQHWPQTAGAAFLCVPSMFDSSGVKVPFTA